jgi:hypothetical protein
MEATSVDPRDQRWEIARPTYRVYFHTPSGSSDEHEVAGGDVSEVMAWAEANAAGRTFVLYACVRHDGVGLVRLLGTDPNRS